MPCAQESYTCASLVQHDNLNSYQDQQGVTHESTVRNVQYFAASRNSTAGNLSGSIDANAFWEIASALHIPGQGCERQQRGAILPVKAGSI
jgi:hypothetical protein